MKVRVEGPSRLHLGIVDMRGSSGRKYGSFGLALNYPATVIEAEFSDSFIVSGRDAHRVEEFAGRFISKLGLEDKFRIEIVSSPPSHSGLGSGTQLALSTGKAISILTNLNLSTYDIARIMGRGSVSGVGIYAFEHGGFILDGGHGKGDLPPLLVRYEIPENWYAVIGIPEMERVWGHDEKRLMNLVSQRGMDTSERISRILLMNLLPAIVEEDFSEFVNALDRIDVEVGKSFSVAQSGIVRERIIQDGIEFLREMGAGGCGQSSWGPAFYGFVEGLNKARKLARSLEKFISEVGEGISLYTNVRNAGAKVDVID